MTIQLSTIQPDHEQLVTQFQIALANKDAWKDKLTTSTGQTLIELIAADGTYSQYAIATALQEAFDETARRDSSIYAIARMLGVRLTRKSPAACTVMLTRAVTTSSLNIPPYSAFTSSLGASLFNRLPIVFNAGEATKSCTLYEGEIKITTLKGTGLDFQVFLSEDTSFVVSDLDVVVSVDSVAIPVVHDGLWHYKNSASAVQDRTSKDGNLILTFGNTNYGFQPIDNSVIDITYCVTQGTSGNNAAFTDAKVTFATDSSITGVPSTSLSGGLDQKPASTYRRVSAQLFADDNKAVTPQDYKAAAASYSGVYDAFVVGQRHLSTTNNAYMNLIRVSLLINGTWTNQQYDDFFTWYQERTMYSGRFYREDPTARPINITANLYLTNTTIPADAIASVETALSNLLSPRFGILGLDIYKSDIHAAIKNAHVGINFVDLNIPTGDCYCETPAVSAPLLTHVAGTLAAGNYSYGVTAVTAQGETKMVNVSDLIVATGSSGITLAWTAVPYAVTYNVYGRTTASYLKLTNTASLTWTDDGSATPTTAPPDVDTTGVHYPSLGTVTLTTQFTSRDKVL